MQARAAAGGFVTFPEPLEGSKVRERSEKFFDHFSQATLFFHSQSDAEKDHIVEALRFELGKVERPHIRQRMVAMLARVNENLAARVAEGLGLPGIPKMELPINHSFPADGDSVRFEPTINGHPPGESPALSMANTVKDTVVTRKVAILASDGVDTASLKTMQDALVASGAQGKIVATHLGVLTGADGDELPIDFSLLTTSSVLFDAVYVPGGTESVASLARERDAIEFVTDAYRHCKPIAATSEGVELLRTAGLSVPNKGSRMERANGSEGILMSTEAPTGETTRSFLAAIAQHRFWTRTSKNRLGPPSGDETRGRAAAPPPAQFTAAKKTRDGHAQRGGPDSA
jgi:catalase